MSDPRRFAWLVLVPSDEHVSAAILSGKSLLATKTTGDVLAVVSNTLSPEKLDLLEESFDEVLVRRISPERKGMKSLDALLLSCATLSSVRRGIVLAPGVLVASQVDHIFDTEEAGILAVSSSQQWLAFLLSPNSYQANKLLSKATLNNNEGKVILEPIFKETDREPIVAIELQENNLRCWKDTANTDRSSFFHLREGTVPMEPGALWNPEPRALHVSRHVKEKDLVAVVGMASRFPQANNLEEYWTILENGDCTVSTVPSDRLRLLNTLDGTVKAHFLKQEIDKFDANFFEMSPVEAAFADPQARLLLEVSWEALENAAVNPEQLRGSRTGVFYGSWLQDYKEAMDQEGFARQETLRKYLANGFGCSSAKLSYFYGLTGPNVSTESACSSSLAACHLALKSLRTRECSMAMVCGSNLILNLGRQARLWSPDGLSKSFDVGADGYARGEGVAVLLLKRYGDALRDGNIVHGLIRGSALTQDKMSKSFGTPTSESEAAAMREALRVAGVDPSQVDYLEAHVTGTSVGDPVEADAIAQVYRSSDPRPAPLWVGSGKTNIGHTESSSGLAGLIKVLLAMKKEKIPKHIHLTQLNPAVKFDEIPAKIPLEAQPWPRNERRVRIAGVSSFGITGTDVHLIVQEPPLPPAPDTDTESEENVDKEKQLLLISAKSEGALKELMVNFATLLMTTSQRLKDVCFTAATCRAHHRPYRLSFAGSTKEEMCDQLQQPQRLDNCLLKSSILKAEAPKIVLSFPGMIGNTDLTPVRELFETSRFVRQMMTDADALFMRMCPERRSLIETIHSPEFIATNPVEYFFLVPTVQYVLAKLWMRWGLSPDLVIGHCHGELAALLICGVFSLEDVYSLVPMFQTLVLQGRSHPVVLLAVSLNTPQTEEYINQFLSSFPTDEASWLDVACMNHSQQTIVAGPRKTIDSFMQYCEQKNARPKLVTVELTAHCRWVENVRDLALDSFNRISYRPGTIPFLSSISGQLHPEIDGTHMYHVWRHTINYPATCATLAQSFKVGRESVVIIEVGTSSLLSKFTRKNLAELMPPKDAAYFNCLPTCLQKDTRFVGTLQAVYEAGVNLRWEQIYEDWSLNAEGFRKVSIPSYPFQRKQFWFKKESSRAARVAPMINPQTIVHPLLGRVITGPGISTDKLVFSNESFEQVLSYGATRFLEDHVLGEMIILPGAAFLEMVLAAGSFALKSQTLHVVDFKIHAPLLLSNEMELSLQTILKKDADSQKISVYSSLVSGAGDPDHNSWRLHVTATLLPEQQPETLAAPHLELLPPLCEKKATLFYDRLYELGLQFGAAFKSLERYGSVENEESNYLVASLVPGGDQEEFLCHPVLSDAMIQAAMISNHPDLRKLHIPVKIASFLLFPDTRNESTSDDRNKWLVIADKRTRSVYLVDSVTRAVRAVMNSPELLPTNVEAVRRAAGQGQNSTDHRLETFLESWEPTPLYQPSELVAPNNRRYVTNDKIAALQAREDEAMSVGSPAQILDSHINTLCSLCMARALRTLSLDNVDALSILANKPEQKGITAPHLQSAFRHFVAYVSAKDSPWPSKLAQPMDVLEREISSILEEPPVKEYAALQIISQFGDNLVALLMGQLSPHKILFDRDGKAEQYYSTSQFRRGLEVAKKIFEDLLPRETKGTTLRILEVGAGTGVFTKVALPMLLESKIPFEYHFTDISPILLSQSRAALEKEYPFSSNDQQLLFRVLNVENDPLEQGYPLDYFDLVVAVDVLHATKNLLESVSHLRQLCRAGASVIISETLRPVPEFDLTFGLLEGFWRFEDKDLRSSHCTISNEKWLQLLAKVGFTEHQGSVMSHNGQKSVIFAATPGMGHVPEDPDSIKSSSPVVMGNPEGDKSTWLVYEIGDSGATNTCNQTLVPYLKKVPAREFKRIKIHPELKGDQLKEWVRETLVPYIPSSAAQFRNKLKGVIMWLNAPQLKEVQNEVTRSFMEPILVLTQELLSATKSRPKLLLVTPEQNNPYTGMAWGFMRNILVEVPGLKAKCVELDTTDKRWTEYLCTELWVDDKETEVVYRSGTRHGRRLRQNPASERKAETSNGLLPWSHGNKEFCVSLPKSKLLSELAFVPKSGDETPLSDTQIKISVRCAGVNFKDVLIAMNPPDLRQDTGAVIGLEFAGVVKKIGSGVQRWKEGDPVFGCVLKGGALQSHMILEESQVERIPEHLSFAEAATVPVVYITVWHCLVNNAKIKPGQTILVHAVSGGVGLAAIQVARFLGARVIGTAGSAKKRRYAKAAGASHVFNSRTVDFSRNVCDVTEGKGVDVVLNCLTGPGFKEASLDVCKDGGYFVEIGKMNVWTEEDVKETRPRVNYALIDAAKLSDYDVSQIFSRVVALLDERELSPLPNVQYPASEIHTAFQTLLKAQHIGKVCITMPNSEGKEALCNERSTYVITGGKGAIGMALCEWMVAEQGAKFVVLVGRNPAQEDLLNRIAELNREHQAHIVCSELDVSDFDQCKNLICHEIPNTLHFPPIRGIHHCAGVLSDRALAQQDWPNFQSLFKPKVEATVNLHRLTYQLPHLEHFVLHSSVALTIGIAGQSNYATANAFLDGMARLRRAHSLPALSINWGKWDVGLAADMSVDFAPPFSVQSGIEMMEAILRNGRYSHFFNDSISNVMASTLKPERVLARAPHYKTTLLKHIKINDGKGDVKRTAKLTQALANAENERKTPSEPEQVAAFANAYADAQNAEVRRATVRTFIIRRITEILNLPENEISPNTSFSTMGMDSLMRIEFVNLINVGIEQIIGEQLGGDVIDAEKHDTLDALVELVAGILEKTRHQV